MSVCTAFMLQWLLSFGNTLWTHDVKIVCIVDVLCEYVGVNCTICQDPLTSYVYGYKSDKVCCCFPATKYNTATFKCTHCEKSDYTRDILKTLQDILI